MTEAVVLCEGYYDRAFWAGLLLFLGCLDPGVKQGIADRIPVKDIRGEAVTQGQFYYTTAGGNGIRVVPCHGKDKIPRTLRRFLEQRNTRQFVQLVVNVDADDNADGTSSGVSALKSVAIENLVRTADAGFQTTPTGAFTIDSGAAEITMIRWMAQDETARGLPNQQTLERLVCAAIVAAYPKRGQCVQEWLDARHLPPPNGVKEFAWSHMAGWYPEHGCDDFYRCLWDDAQVAAELKARLEVSGAWHIAEALAG